MDRGRNPVQRHFLGCRGYRTLVRVRRWSAVYDVWGLSYCRRGLLYRGISAMSCQAHDSARWWHWCGVYDAGVACA